MASKIIVDQLEKTGGLLTPLTLPSANGTVGQYLKNDGSGVLGWVAPPTDTQGLTYASQWRINTQISCSGTAPGTILSANWEVPLASDFPGVIGSVTPMVVNASTGAWTFPATGVWQVSFSGNLKANTGNHLGTLYVYTTHNTGVAWEQAATDTTYHDTNITRNSRVTFLVVIATVATDLVRFSIGTDIQSSELMVNAGANRAYATFIKLGDAS